MTAPPIVRPSDEQDLNEIQAILAYHVRTGTANFDEMPPDLDAVRARREQVLALGLPHLVAAAGGEILGFAYAAPFRERVGYRFTAEDSVYVREGCGGRGLGRALLKRLLEDAAAAGRTRMIAVIGDSANLASIRLHAAAGFARIGVLPEVGFKFGRWLDVVMMQHTTPVAQAGGS